MKCSTLCSKPFERQPILIKIKPSRCCEAVLSRLFYQIWFKIVLKLFMDIDVPACGTVVWVWIRCTRLSGKWAKHWLKGTTLKTFLLGSLTNSMPA